MKGMNPMYPVDLHVHTNCSDGSYPPEEVVRKALDAGVRVLGITDHDNVSGVERAIEEGRRLGVEVVPGVEISVDGGEEEGNRELHILGYFIDPGDPDFRSLLQKVADARIEQKIRQIKLLQKFGLQIDVDEVLALAKGVPGRMHIARTLMKRNPGRFRDIQQIFDEFLSRKGRAYVRRSFYLTPAQAIEAIIRVGGIPVLAHPGVYHLPRDSMSLILRLKEAGLRGIEISYTYDKNHPHRGASPEFVEGMMAEFSAIADELGLLKTGGSDYHGDSKDITIGERGLTWLQYQDFKLACL